MFEPPHTLFALPDLRKCHVRAASHIVRSSGPPKVSCSSRLTHCSLFRTSESVMFEPPHTLFALPDLRKCHVRAASHIVCSSGPPKMSCSSRLTHCLLFRTS